MMLVSLLVLLISLIPAVLVYIYLSRIHGKEDDFCKESKKTLIKGVLCCFGVTLFALLLNILWSLSGLGKGRPLLDAAVHAFVYASFTEELTKLLTALSIVRKSERKHSWMDLIAVYGIVALGFNFIESLIYSLNTSIIQIIVRGLTVPHAAYGLAMGYYIGKARYESNKLYCIPAFLIPFLLHGLYDFSLADELLAVNDNFVFLPFILILIDLIILVRMLKLVAKAKKEGGKYTEELPEI